MRPLPLGARRRRFPPGVIFLGVFVLPLLAWSSYNAWDYPLKPGAARLLEAPIETVPDAENLFLAWLAFPIAGDEPAHERGRAALRAFESAPRTENGPRSYAQALDRPVARFDDADPRLCSIGNQPGAYHCIRDSLEQVAALEQQFARLQPLLLRYRELDGYPRYVDVRPAAPDLPAPDVTILRVGQLYLSALALATTGSSVEDVVAHLTRSAAIWRRALASPEVGVVEKMMASRALLAHLMFASELIRNLQPTQTAALQALDAFLAPLSETERSLRGPVQREFRQQAQIWSALADPSSTVVRNDLPDTSAWWYRILMKRNDTINRSYADLERLLALEQRGCPAVREELQAAAQRPQAGELGLLEYFYNPIGRVLHSMGGGASSYLEYLGRECNLLAVQRMVRLQLALKRENVAPQDYAAQVKARASTLDDPNSGRAFVYDAQARTLGFEVIGKGEHLSPMPVAP